MSQTAFILILAEDDDAGQRLREVLRDSYGHSCSVVGGLADALDSIRARAPDVVVTRAVSAGSPAAGPLAELLDAIAHDAALLVLGDGALPPTRYIQTLRLPEAREPEKLAQVSLPRLPISTPVVAVPSAAEMISSSQARACSAE